MRLLELGHLEVFTVFTYYKYKPGHKSSSVNLSSSLTNADAARNNSKAAMDADLPLYSDKKK